MRRFALLSLLGVAIATAQTNQFTANCSYRFILSNRTQDVADSTNQPYQFIYQLASGAGTTAAISNLDCQADAWTVKYIVEGFSAINYQFEDAPLSRQLSTSGLVLQNTAGAFTAWQGGVPEGSNPSTSLSNTNTAKYYGYYPYIRVNVVSSSGTGSLIAYVEGWRRPQFFGISYLPPGTNGQTSLKYYYNNNVNGTNPASVKSAAGLLYGATIYNTTGSACYMQVFDNNPAGITLGVTVPNMSFPVTGSGNSPVVIPPSIYPIMNFLTGLTFAGTTSSQGSSTCQLVVDAWFY